MPAYIPPIAVHEVERELRLILMIHANQLAAMRDTNSASTFLGAEVDWEEWDGGVVSFDLEAFAVWRLLRLAHDFAYQLNDPSRYLDENRLSLNSILEGFAKCSVSGMFFSPLLQPDSVVRQVGETAAARYLLDHHGAVTIEQATFLLDCSLKTAVGLLGKAATDLGLYDYLYAKDLAPILATRKGYVPTRTDCLPWSIK